MKKTFKQKSNAKNLKKSIAEIAIVFIIILAFFVVFLYVLEQASIRRFNLYNQSDVSASVLDTNGIALSGAVDSQISTFDSAIQSYHSVSNNAASDVTQPHSTISNSNNQSVSSFESSGATIEENENTSCTVLEYTQQEEIYSHFSLDNKQYKLNLEPEYQSVIKSYCDKYKLDLRIILGIMTVETGCDIDIGTSTDRSGIKYYGVGCISELSHKELLNCGIDIKTIPGQIEGVCFIFKQKLEEFNNTHKALIAYNCGSAGANKLFNKNITQTEYSTKVLEVAYSLI